MSTTDSNMEDLQSLNLIRQGGKMREQGVAALYRKYAGDRKKPLNKGVINKWVIYRSDFKLNDAEAEEIVQETFIKVVRHCESYQGNSSIKTWMFSIALNCMTDYLRRSNIHLSVNLDDDRWDALEQGFEAMHTFDPPPADETLEDCVGRGFTEFAKRFSERAYVLSLVMEGFDTAHIASTIQRTPGATREFISQSRKRIEEFLRPCREYLSAT